MHAGKAAFKKYIVFSVIGIFGFLKIAPCEAAIKDWLKTPPCTLAKDPAAVFPLFSLCLEGSAGEWMEQRSRVEDNVQPPVLLSTKGAATIVFTSWISFRASGYALFHQSRVSSGKPKKEARSENLIVQIGNMATHRHRVFVGRTRIPFGINFDANVDWLNPGASDPFFGEPLRLVGYTYDNLKDLTFSVAAGTADNIDADAKRRKSASGARIMYDLSALEGTRLVASFATDELEHRRGNVGAVNVNGKGDITAFEVIRTWSNYPYDPQDFNQLIRLSWIGLTSEPVVPHVQYEDQLDFRRIGTVGAKFNAKENIAMSLYTGYSKDETGAKRSYWLGVAGVEVHL